ncbi:hypothetical protein PybrP1_004493 [[Pythium] brassicae (nom. inval.)]|nr:hypothetical protein PybrP1_004493 [[Pythium] brassicae (nom. inval.)]
MDPRPLSTTAKSQRTPKDILTDLLLEFVQALVHEFLFLAKVYPPDSFEQRVLYDVPLHMNRYPALTEYIRSMLAGCRAWLHAGELEKLCIVVLSAHGRTVETLVVETKWAMATAPPRGGGDAATRTGATLSTSTLEERSPGLPLVKIEEALRAALVALVAVPRPADKPTCPPSSFRILAHTTESSVTPDTSIAASSVQNSWVLADPFWYDNTTDNVDNEEEEEEDGGSKHGGGKQLLPLKSVRANELPFTLQLYLEEPTA